MLTGDIRAVDVTQFALEALIDDVILLERRHPACVEVDMTIDVAKEGRERWAELDAPTTAVARVEHTSELHTSVGLVEVHRMMWIVGNGHETSVCATNVGAMSMSVNKPY